jgi:DNA-binding winged helix-turn-helix (wHTH) protein
MPTERIDRAKIEAGPDRSPERLPKFSETVRSDGSGKSVQALSMGDRIVDLNRDALLDRQGAVIPLRPRAWLVLKFLAQRAGRLVEKNELLEEVWADCVVTEDSLVQAIGDIRRALGDAGRTALRTLPRRGYILVPDKVRAPTLATISRIACAQRRRRVSLAEILNWPNWAMRLPRNRAVPNFTLFMDRAG